MAPSKQRTTANPNSKSSKKAKARLAISKRWKSIQLNIDKPRPSAVNPDSRPIGLPFDTITENDKLPSSTKTSDKSMDMDNNTTEDVYSNTRKTDFINSEIQIGLDENVESLPSPEYIFVDKKCLYSLVEKLVCPKCFSPGLEILFTNKLGYNLSISIECKECSDTIASESTSPKLADNSYDINKRIIKSFLSISKGHYAMEQFSLVMNMPCMSSGLFTKVSKQVHKAKRQNVGHC